MIEITNQQTVLPFEEDQEEAMERAARVALSLFGAKRSVVCAAIVDDETIRSLNRQYRGIDRPTDVLSFAAREGEQIFSSRKGEFLGDIAISLETAVRQAEEFGHSLGRELAFLTVHGILHLLGYDHMTPEDEEEIRGLQREILDRAGLSVKGE
jgi:probable rRNA maturation factor